MCGVFCCCVVVYRSSLRTTNTCSRLSRSYEGGCREHMTERNFVRVEVRLEKLSALLLCLKFVRRMSTASEGNDVIRVGAMRREGWQGGWWDADGVTEDEMCINIDSSSSAVRLLGRSLSRVLCWSGVFLCVCDSAAKILRCCQPACGGWCAHRRRNIISGERCILEAHRFFISCFRNPACATVFVPMPVPTARRAGGCAPEYEARMFAVT